MAYKNEFGKYLKLLRDKYGYNQDELAQALEISGAFLSKIESDKKSIPESIIFKIIKLFNLSEEEQRLLYNSVDISHKKIEINLDNLDNETRETVLLFYRNLPNMDTNQINKIKQIINKF